MQYKKKDIYEKIIEAGKSEYLDKGFRGGNIGSIASRAGISVGNIYRYFEGKDALLDAIVKPIYCELPKTIQNLAKLDNIYNLSLEKLEPILVQNVLDIFEQYGKEILILIDKCQDTIYEDFFNNIVHIVDEIIVDKLFYNTDNQEARLMSHIISKSFIGSMFDILRNGLIREKIENMLHRVLKFYFLDIEDRVDKAVKINEQG